MLWSLLKIVVFVALIAAATFGLGYLIESDGTGLAEALVVINGTEYALSPLKLALAGLLFLIAAYVLFKLAGLLIALLKYINGDDTALSRYFDRNRERKGYQALADGLMALASGEGRLAMAKAAKADKYLHKPELTDLVTAQAAEMLGDQKKAEEVYKRLIQDDKTRFVGIRGIMKQKLDAGDTDTALKLAERAFALKPKHTEVQDTLLRLQAETEDYEGARKTLSSKLKTGSMPRDLYKRRDAVLALSQAQAIGDEEASGKAAEAAIAANKSAPDLIPAAAMAARGFIAQGRPRNAVKVLKKAWGAQPHPDLAAAFAEIAPEETPAERVKRFGVLTAIQPDHRETRLLKAELNLAAEDFPAARRAVGDLVDSDPDARVLAVMAAIEKGEGAPDEVVRGWLARALTASRGPQWVCESCQTIHAEWAPLCSKCGAFDTFAWTTPQQSEVVLPAGADMLPLIVGQRLEAASVTPEVAPKAPVDEVDLPPEAEIVEDTPEALRPDAPLPEGDTAPEAEVILPEGRPEDTATKPK